MPFNKNINNNITVRSVRSKRAKTVFESDSSGSNRNSKQVRLQTDMLSEKSSEEATCHEDEKKSKADRFVNCIGQCSSKNHNNIVNDQRKLPNVIKWTCDEIHEYFKIFFPLQAHVFHDEGIDGEALYQLKREDVLSGFKLKVGPAIKIYEHILKMQTERGV